ncbi:hypothetical protein PS645_05089 [Pseudomonas fluorescens]|uniref:Uncharacterized protein n=1 Tax=Pseudomonas fluorescens TaxID=294 RepID=A0A5E6X3T0_PSEFL|nr:hypothetical protein PS645_05089 [Pseudomonas fluorescens]
MHQHAITHAQFAEQDAFALAIVAQAQARSRQQIDQLRGGGSGSLAGAALQIAPRQQEQREHANRVEIQFTHARDRGPDAGDVSPADRQRHGHVHGQMPGAQIPHRAFEEGRATVEHDRCGQEQRHPAQDGVQFGAEIDVEFRPGRHGRHHRLKPQQAGHAELAQRLAILAGQLFTGAVGLIGVGGVADLAQFAQHLAQRQLCIGPAHMQAVVGQVQARFGDCGQAAQVFFDQPAARGATDAFHQQGGFGEVAVVMDERLLYVGAIIQSQLIDQLHGQAFWIGRGFTAMLVIIFQPPGHNRFGHRLATRTAELAGFAEDGGGEAAAGRHGQGAVVAGGWRGHY